MATKRHRYRVDVYRDNAGEIHTLIRTTPGDLPYVWCPHTVRAISKASARHKAQEEHLAHEPTFRATLAQDYPEAEHLRTLLQQYGSLRHPAARGG